MHHPSTLHAFLTRIGKRASRGLSQNFLIDGNIIQKTLDLAEVTAGDRIMEIGPGPGALTEALLDRGAHVLAIEMDPLFAHELYRLQTEDCRLEVIMGDALDYTLPLFPKKMKIVANLPYHITTPLLTTLVTQNDRLSSITVMVQREVADRIFAEPGGKQQGSLTLFLQIYAKRVAHFPVSRRCFFPKPTVDSAVCRLDLQEPDSRVDPSLLEKVIRTAFQQRRKQLRNSLKKLDAPHILQRIEALSLGEKRPEQLCLEDFMRILE